MAGKRPVFREGIIGVYGPGRTRRGNLLCPGDPLESQGDQRGPTRAGTPKA